MKPAVKTKLPARREDKSDVALPEWMKGDAGKGRENIDNEDLDIPRLKLIQGLSPELEEFNRLRPGMFFHSSAEHIFDEPFVGVPIYYEKRYILWRPQDDGGGILARADDGIHWSPSNTEFTVKLNKKDGGQTVKWKTAKTVPESGLAAWGSMNPNDQNSPPAATRMMTFVLAFPDHPELMPAVLTFQRSSIKVGRKFLTKIKTNRAPIFALRFEFSSTDDKNGVGNTFKNVSVKADGLVTDRALYDQYKSLHETFGQTGLKIKDIEGLQDEDAGGEDDEEAPAKGSRGGKATSGRPAY